MERWHEEAQKVGQEYPFLTGPQENWTMFLKWLSEKNVSFSELLVGLVRSRISALPMCCSQRGALPVSQHVRFRIIASHTFLLRGSHLPSFKSPSLAIIHSRMTNY